MSHCCGIDWAEGHHDTATVDHGGALVSKTRITDDPDGFTALTQLLTEAGDTAENPFSVTIETPRGLLVAALRRRPHGLCHQPDRRHPPPRTASMACTNSGPIDAMALANILRFDAHMHRPMPADTELAQAIAVLARAQQDAV